ncbi:MAG: QueT transporter family protein [Oscillospiraceae bacterium]|nr:QueT transporter family protein [Oscillospiraceae bacterium]
MKTMKKTNTRSLAYGAVIAALYVVLTLLQNVLLPGTASMAVQFRVSEALCILCLFTPSAIGGLSLGCLLFNLTAASALPLDWFVGTAATALSAMAMYQFRNLRLWKIPVLSLLMPAVFNGLLIGAELTVYIKEFPLWINMLCVAAGELGVLLTLGIGLYFALLPLKDRLFG